MQLPCAVAAGLFLGALLCGRAEAGQWPFALGCASLLFILLALLAAVMLPCAAVVCTVAVVVSTHDAWPFCPCAGQAYYFARGVRSFELGVPLCSSLLCYCRIVPQPP